MNGAHRRLELSPGRVPRWWQRFHDDHPNVTTSTHQGEVVLTSTNGSTARFVGWYPVGDDGDPLSSLLTRPTHVGALLIRRGGYSLGYFASFNDPDGGPITDHTTGRRYVQGRTAAGGWSQQRFARRRTNQAEALVKHVAEEGARIIKPVLTHPDHAGLVVGGDEALVRDLLSTSLLAPLTSLVRREFFDIPSPKFAVLQQIHSRAQTVRVSVHNP
ncbi:MAG TPA: acVLRF1 family peptidyl-tRNA hydrolase [Beutenbergiaceae bacterium]|nr:acVLRF1 family peptidyl-tRNA hydrolase [Beutenbergiaceae bacterium]